MTTPSIQYNTILPSMKIYEIYLIYKIIIDKKVTTLLLRQAAVQGKQIAKVHSTEVKKKN